jgi:GxxExxY protein
MTARNIPFREQVTVPINYKGQQLQHLYRADYLAYDKIIVEIKAIKTTTEADEAQLLHYLRATHLRLGLLINFGHPGKLQWMRRVY